MSEAEKSLPPSRELDKFIIRLPEGMRGALKQIARSNNRTLSAEIVSRLQRTLEEDRPQTEATEARSELARKRIMAAKFSDAPDPTLELLRQLQNDVSAIKEKLGL